MNKVWFNFGLRESIVLALLIISVSVAVALANLH